MSFQKAVLALAVLLGAQGAFAGSTGDAGCGLGSVIFKDNKKGLQLLAMTTNLSTYTQFFGITTGTSGCSSTGIAMTDKEQTLFVEMNYDKISNEMAQGQGEYLNTFAYLLGCDQKSISAFGSKAQGSYPVIMEKVGSPSEFLNEVKQNLKQDQNLSKSCKGLTQA